MEQINLFIEKIKSDSGLSEKLTAIGAENADAIAAAAKEHGFSFTAEEWGGYLKQGEELLTGEGGRELSPDELEAVAGGDSNGSPWAPVRCISCWFKSGKAGTKTVNGSTHYACGASCIAFILSYGCWFMCNCHDTSRCVGNFHIRNEQCP